MPRPKSDVNKSEEIRKLLAENPKMGAQDVVAKLAERNISVSSNLVYFIKGKMKGRRGRRKRAQRAVANVAATGSSDPLTTIRKIKTWANEVGGLKKLKALVDALSE